MNTQTTGALAAWRSTLHRPSNPFICTTMIRDDVVVDVTIEFEVERGQFWLVDAYLDAPEFGDELTNDEVEQLTVWLQFDGYERALAAVGG